MFTYKPEGYEGGRQAPFSTADIELAKERGDVLEALVQKCDECHNLWVDLGCMKGCIPREEGAVGIAEGTTRDIALLSRVGQWVCFTVESVRTDETGQKLALLSRCRAQKTARETLMRTVKPGDILPAVVTHLERFGAFCDVGCGLVALLPIDAVSVSRIAHPGDRLAVGQQLRVIVRQIADDGRITVSHKELLGTWAQNAAHFCPHQTVVGTVRSVEEYGVFVELTPNLSGLAEPFEGVTPGQRVVVHIKSILPEKMKVKLLILRSLPGSGREPFVYYTTGDHLDSFTYATPQSARQNTVCFDTADEPHPDSVAL